MKEQRNRNFVTKTSICQILRITFLERQNLGFQKSSKMINDDLEDMVLMMDFISSETVYLSCKE